jgi:5'-deoxynucleotidase YfbR-like HD superfamily hydrolase
MEGNQVTELDSEGFIVGQRHYIVTWSGLKVDPLYLDPEDVWLGDIAHALARLCRYNGHTGGFLSVARHSICTSERLEAIGRPDLAKWGLLHDAAEAYLGDMTKPMKTSPEMVAYRDAEQRAEKAIAEAFDLPWPMPAEVVEADRWVLAELELPNMRESYRGNYSRDEQDFLDRYVAIMDPHRVSQKPMLIGLSGYAQTGKDTVATMLGVAGYNRLAFADTLREFLYALDPIIPVKHPSRHGQLLHIEYRTLSSTIDLIGWEWAKVEIPEVRQLLQRLGTECGRMMLGSNVWIDAAFAKMDSVKRYVFSDVRFPNEAEAIKERGGQVWRIQRPGTEPANDHASERALDDYPFDVVLNNDGTKGALKSLVAKVLTGGRTVDAP